VSEQADQFEERDEEEQGRESGDQDRREGTDEGNRESGTGTTGSGKEDAQPRQGEVAHEGELGNQSAPGENDRSSSVQSEGG
jgi:hypothetical protein